VVTVALWSPLSALGVVPFVLWKAVGSMYRERSLRLMHPAVLVPAFAVGIVVAGYLALDLSHIPKGVSLGRDGFLETIMDLSRQAQFFLLEAGFIGFAILAIRWSSEVVLALAILAVLPVVYLGPGNDLVMRASIPSLAVLAIGACLALSRESSKISALRKKRIVLCVFLTIGAVTPAQEIARTAVLSPWPINLQASLIAAGCGQFRHLPHYVARLGSEPITVPLRQPHRLAIGPLGPQSCDNPALLVMWYRNMW